MAEIKRESVREGYKMIIEAYGRINETLDCRGIWINSIDVRLRSGKTLTIDRDTTRYNIDGDNYTMEWIDCYIWNADDGIADYHPERYDWTDAVLTHVDIEDDADVDYHITIDGWEIYR